MPPRPGKLAALREVYQIEPREALNKALFYDPQSGALRPNAVFVDRAGAVLFETNEVGLKGASLDPSRDLVPVWGDSVVFSAGPGWPCLLDALAPGYQFLNGGIEGDLYGDILRRASAFNESHPVYLNLLMPGWHPMRPEGGGNDNLRAELAAFLRRLPNTVLLTVPTALNPDIVGHDLSASLRDGNDDTVFRFLGDFPPLPEYQRFVFDHISERNAIVREVGADTGVRVVDLYAALDTAGSPDFREHFVDIMHLRVRAFPVVARVIHDAIADLLSGPDRG